MTAYHARKPEEVLADLRTTSAGLSAAEAAARLEIHGPNELRETISRPAWKMLLAQFVEPMILILVAAAILSFGLGDVAEGIAILAIVVLFGVLGFIQEYRAEKAMAAPMLHPTRLFVSGRGVAQTGSAFAWGAKGPGFKSRRPDHL